MNVTFEFSVDQKVTTAFGDAGLVTMLAVDDGGKRYYVKTSHGGDWFKSSQLTAA